MPSDPRPPPPPAGANVLGSTLTLLLGDRVFAGPDSIQALDLLPDRLCLPGEINFSKYPAKLVSPFGKSPSLTLILTGFLAPLPPLPPPQLSEMLGLFGQNPLHT